MPAAGHHVLRRREALEARLEAFGELEEELRRRAVRARVMGEDQLAAVWREAADGIKEVLQG